MLELGADGIAMALEPLGDPCLGIFDGILDEAARDGVANDLLEPHARVQQVAIAAVAQQQAVVRVEQREALADRFDRDDQPGMRLGGAGVAFLERLFGPLALGDASGPGCRCAAAG